MKKIIINRKPNIDLNSETVSSILLPKSFKYYDDFSDSFITFSDVESDCWNIICTGDKKSLNFSKYPLNLKLLLKIVIIHIIKNLTPDTAETYLHSFYYAFDLKSVVEILECDSDELRERWEEAKYVHINKNKIQLNHSLSLIKQILIFMCLKNINNWGLKDYDIIRSQKHFFIDKYTNLRNGDCFLTINEEELLIKYLDEQNKICKLINNENLISACLICLMYQFGFRAKQLSLIKNDDLNLFKTEGNEIFSVHVKVEKIKQRSSQKMYFLTRKIRIDWQNIFIELKQRNLNANSENNKLFLNQSRVEIILMIKKITTKILGNSRGANSFRHSAAQRMVNAGATANELSDFLGHSNPDSCLVYFANSPEQVERINHALSISDVYSKTSLIAHGKILTIEELNDLPIYKQLAGFPHGIEITGIGGCDLTQKLCPSNPITSCYGCRKFLPVNNILMHEKVKDSLKGIVLQFYEQGAADPYSPTYLQLKQVLENIESIITELKGENNEQI